jgi:hypothetical protein
MNRYVVGMASPKYVINPTLGYHKSLTATNLVTDPSRGWHFGSRPRSMAVGVQAGEGVLLTG